MKVRQRILRKRMYKHVIHVTENQPWWDALMGRLHNQFERDTGLMHIRGSIAWMKWLRDKGFIRDDWGTE